jgi:hypothetical protein
MYRFNHGGKTQSMVIATEGWPIWGRLILLWSKTSILAAG